MDFEPATRAFEANPSPASATGPGSGALCTPTAYASGCGAAVCVSDVDENTLTTQQVRERLATLRQAESKLEAMKSRALANYSSRCGQGMARQAAVEELQASRGQARKELQTAEQLAQAAETTEALSAGLIPAGHAKLIAKAASDGPIDQPLMVEAAKREDYATFNRTLRDHQREVSADDGKSLLASQRQERRASIRPASDGMYEFFGRFDPVAGNRIEASLSAEVRRIRSQKNAKDDDRTLGQMLADAAEHLICAEAEGRRPQGTTLILTADWDQISKQLADARLLDGTPLPGSETMRLACDAGLLPAVYNSGTQELCVGRKHRSATEAQRAALIVRDKHCIGCGKSATWCEAHHIIPWQDGGLTDIDNLVLVCPACHHDIHDRKWQVHKDPRTGKYQLLPTFDPDPFPLSLPGKPPTSTAGRMSMPATNGHPHSKPRQDSPEPFPDAPRKPGSAPTTQAPQQHSAGEPPDALAIGRRTSDQNLVLIS